MNYRLVSRYLGYFSFAIGAMMLPVALWALYFGEHAELPAILMSIALASVFGGILALIGWTAGDKMYRREALTLVGMSWIVAVAIGALPYVFSDVLGPVDAFFESMSGFTPTGATVIEDIESTPKSILFWRQT